MNTSDLAVLILVSTVAYFVVSRLARRPGKEVPILIFMSRRDKWEAFGLSGQRRLCAKAAGGD